VKAKNNEMNGVDFTGIYHNMYGISLFGSKIDVLLNELIAVVKKERKKPFWIATVNPEFVMKTIEDKAFFEILQQTDLNVIDGIGLVWAILVKNGGNPIKVGWEIIRGGHREELIPGVELMEGLCKEASKNNLSVYFYGGWGDRAERTADYMVNKYLGLKVIGYSDEKFDFETKADILFVARGMKKQEEWINNNLEKLKVGLVMGVGRSFDYFSGDLQRAPEVVRKMGFEWLYSLYKEPQRWRRQLALPKFVWKMLFKKL